MEEGKKRGGEKSRQKGEIARRGENSWRKWGFLSSFRRDKQKCLSVFYFKYTIPLSSLAVSWALLRNNVCQRKETCWLLFPPSIPPPRRAAAINFYSLTQNQQQPITVNPTMFNNQIDDNYPPKTVFIQKIMQIMNKPLLYCCCYSAVCFDLMCGERGGGGAEEESEGERGKLERQRQRKSINTLVNESQLFTPRWASQITDCVQDADCGWQLKMNCVHGRARLRRAAPKRARSACTRSPQGSSSVQIYWSP